MSNEEVSVLALLDQLWASLGASRTMDTIRRLAEGGFDGSEFDLYMVQMLASTVMGELLMRKAMGMDLRRRGDFNGSQGAD